MSKTILANFDGFTPVIDELVIEVGLVAAAVFGKVWRYCQMSDGVCTASHQRLADELKISTSTLDRHLAVLVSSGYLAEIRQSGNTNTYKDTGMASLHVGIVASTPGKLKGDTPSNLKRGTPSKLKGVPLQNEEGPSANCRPNIDIKKEVKKDLEYESEPDEKFSAMQKIIETLTGRLSTPGDISTLEKFTAEGVTEADIRAAIAWRIEQGLRPAANIRQLEAGILRNKAERIQKATAATVKPAGAGQPVRKETALDRTKAALSKVMAEAMEEERNGN